MTNWVPLCNSRLLRYKNQLVIDSIADILVESCPAPTLTSRLCPEICDLSDREGVMLGKCYYLAAVHCRTLTWLNLSHNELHSLDGIQTLTNLAGDITQFRFACEFYISYFFYLHSPSVLSASCNAITTCGDLSPLKSKQWSPTLLSLRIPASKMQFVFFFRSKGSDSEW